MAESLIAKMDDPTHRVVCPHCGTESRLAPAGDEPESDAGLGEDAPEFPDEEAAFRARVAERIERQDFEVPLLPHVALRVIRLAGDAKSSMQDLAKVILTDQGIAARVLKIANSPVYAGAAPARTINQAVVRLGQREIKDMMLAIAMQTRIFKSAAYHKRARRLWEHAVGVAIAARVVANALRLGREEVFLAGLMHDLGKMILLNVLERAQKDAGGYKPSDATVDDLIERHHAGLGELLVLTWDLPDLCAEAIRFIHHEVDGEVSREAAAVALANDICEAKGIGLDAVTVDPAAGAGYEKLALTPDALEELIRRFDDMFAQAKASFL
ncbi:MAG: HDOD domain-containing protein [Deltaproteobacteria bacterium]|nr:HDOD domain-containing protein [Deltaproteobacteria bacterium]